MPVSVIPSAGQTVEKQKSTARKRRRNQNVEIDELAALVPLAMPLVPSDNSVRSLVPGSNKPPAIDKISVLRLTSTFLKLQDFLKETSPQVAGRREKLSALNVLGPLEEALDGFLIVLDKEANILYASETITGYVGLSQQDVIGQNLVDISHQESEVEIKDNLKPAATPPQSMMKESIVSQFRQFYIRFRSTVSPSRMQLSRFTSHTMVQINGNLKVRLPPSMEFGKKDVELVEPSVIGFIGECRLIESASSILELSVPHSTFTMTKSLDMKIISVESTVKEIVGYEPEDLINNSVDLKDFFHPADYKRMVPCEKFLMRTGHAVSPHFRFLTSSGDWVWMQLEATLRYKNGTAIPQFWEVKARVLSQGDGKLKYIEQSELYASDPDPDQDILNPHRDFDIVPKLANKSKHCKEEGARPIIDSLKGANLPDSILEPVLHARSVALSKLPNTIKPILDTHTADDFVVQRDQAMMKRNDSFSSSIASSPLSTLSPPSLPYLPSPTSSVGHQGTSLSSTSMSRNGSLSSNVPSPTSSVSSPPISPPMQSQNSPSPSSASTPAPASVQQSVPSPATSVSSRSSTVADGAVDASGGICANIVPLEGGVRPTITGTKRPFAQAQRVANGRGGALSSHGKSNPSFGMQELDRMMVTPTSGNSTSTTAVAVDDHNGRVQSPPSVGSVNSVSSSSGSFTASPRTRQTAQHSFIQEHGINGGSFAETPSPSNSAISAVSSPPSVFSPEMGPGLYAATSSNSIPFQNIFHTSDPIPQASAPLTSNSFNPQIPTSFNFNSSGSNDPTTTNSTSSTSYQPPTNLQNSAYAPNLLNSSSSSSSSSSAMPMETQQVFGNSFSNSLPFPSDPLFQQLLGEMVALNSDPNFNSMAPLSNDTSTNLLSTISPPPSSAATVPSSFAPTATSSGSLSPFHSHQLYPQADFYAPSSSPNPPLPPSSASVGSVHQPPLVPADHVNNTFAMSCDVAMTHFANGNAMSNLLPDSHANSTTTEVQDILQQFQ